MKELVSRSLSTEHLLGYVCSSSFDEHFPLWEIAEIAETATPAAAAAWSDEPCNNGGTVAMDIEWEAAVFCRYSNLKTNQSPLHSPPPQRAQTAP